MKIRPVVAELFHADGQTDRRDEADSRLSQFCELARNPKRCLSNLMSVVALLFISPLFISIPLTCSFKSILLEMQHRNTALQHFINPS